MKQIQVLDCTLRDGGYVNNWEFGRETILGTRRALAATGIKMVELGFFRDEPYVPHRSIFNSIDQTREIIGRKEPDVLYTALIEMANYFPPELLGKREEGNLDAVRYSFWARLMDDAYTYCGRIRDKGYLLCCQPTRVEQYSYEEFGAMCRRFSQLEPYALYIVDTFGLLRKDQLLNYAQVAHENLAPGTVLGYHAHDNMGQSFSNACAFLELELPQRTLQVDASIGGMGRGAGNLRLELILEYLNARHQAGYDLSPVYRIWEQSLAQVLKEYPWGFDFPYFITAANACNPNYAKDFMDMGLSLTEIEAAILRIQGPDKYLYSKEKALQYAGKA